MKIAIATAGRFHVLDLAKELIKQGHEVSFYSYVPRNRAIKKFGLLPAAHRNIFPFVAPLLIIQRILPKYFDSIVNRAISLILDYYVSHNLEKCDILIAMSGIYLNALNVAKDKYGAIIFLERGSTHILHQMEIINTLKKKGLPVALASKYFIDRELAGYELADKIVIPSRHVEMSFLEYKFSKDRLFKNPYGVDFSMFPATNKSVGFRPTVIFVGLWCYRKGVDILLESIKNLQGLQFIHVGPIGDAPMPNLSNLAHIDAVSQWKLSELYSQADIFVMPSREEGLALVQLQALSSGLPLVCTDKTGGDDLREFLPDPNWITVIPSNDSRLLTQSIKEMITKSRKLSGARDLMGDARIRFSWSSYGKRYEEELLKFNNI